MPTLPPEAFPFCGPTNSLLGGIDTQRSINLYPEIELPSSKSRSALIGTPGTTTFITVNSPVRALWAGSFAGTLGRLFAVGGTHVYEISNIGTVIHDYGALAGSGGTGPCYFKENGYQLLVLDTSNNTVYNITNGAGTTAVFNAQALEYLDGFYVAIATGASLAGTNTNQVNVSASLDGTAWNALNYVLKTGSADQAIQLAVVNGQLWVFGQKTIEVWYNAGNAGFPFARIQGATINQGLLAAASVAKVGDSLMWLGSDDRGYMVVYRNVGLQPVRTSTTSIETLIAPFVGQAIRAFPYQEAGHLFYVLSLGTVQTVVYDITTGQWHERNWYNAGNPGRILGDCFASVNNFPAATSNFVGDYSSGKIFSQSLSTASDFGGSIQRIRIAPIISNQNKWLKYRKFTLDADLGTAVPSLSYQNSSGGSLVQTYSMTRTAAPASGGLGQYYAYQLGRARERIFRVVVVDSANVIRLVNAYVDASPGIER